MYAAYAVPAKSRGRQYYGTYDNSEHQGMSMAKPSRGKVSRHTLRKGGKKIARQSPSQSQDQGSNAGWIAVPGPSSPGPCAAAIARAGASGTTRAHEATRQHRYFAQARAEAQSSRCPKEAAPPEGLHTCSGDRAITADVSKQNPAHPAANVAMHRKHTRSAIYLSFY